MVRLRKGDGKYKVTAASIVDIGTSKQGADYADMGTEKAISSCLQLIGAQTKLAVCSVCGPEVAVRDFKFPALPQEEIEGAVLLEASQVCPFATEQSTIDYQLIPDGDDHIRGVMVAATNTLIKKKVQLAKRVSLNCVLMDVDGLALLNCFKQFGECEPGRASAVLNVGSSYTTLAIVGDNELPFVRDIAYAGHNITKQIADETDMPIETVEETLSADSTVERLELRDNLERACEELIIDVNETLRYYMAQAKSGIAQKIFVCGGFALVKGFVELLNSRLPAEAVLWNPFDKIPCDLREAQKDIVRKKGPAMAVAAGLAMRSI
jgi:type IV pilus assembly protein PilM